MKRRGALFVGIGGAAAVVGVGLGLRRQRQALGTAAPPDPWTLRFERPEGGSLALADWRGRPLLLNFWATWCPPCVREMPLLDRFHREQAGGGWQVLGLAVDRPEAVRDFLRHTPVGYPIALAASDGLGIARRYGNDSGGLPYTVVLDGEGAVLHRRLGGLEPGELEQWSRRLG